ncbi:MAG TPA: metallophosphoesterase [Acidimicrobiales bacterium]|nr:metallophosphoesterase [Acidimicrobiales bacterium]
MGSAGDDGALGGGTSGGAARVVVVSDTHLSPRAPEAVANWAAVVDHVAATAPDLVVHAGDVTAQGDERPDELTFAADHLGRLAAPLALVPGNHDVGDPPSAVGGHGVLVDADRLARFRSTFGTDRFVVDVGRWRVVGLDAQVLGSGLAAEDDQWQWLEAELAAAAGPSPHVAVVLHKPLATGPGDGRHPRRYVPPAAVPRLAALLDAAGAAVVVSGHVHQWLRHAPDGVLHVWAPTSWAVLPDSWQPPVGHKVTGVVELVLHDDGRVDADLVRPVGLGHHMAGSGIGDPYAADG